jgi:hypothetical protein
VNCVPKTNLTACTSPGPEYEYLYVYLYTNPFNGPDHWIRQGQTLTLSDLQRSYWAIRGFTHSPSTARFNLVGRTRFELEYRNALPTTLRDIYYPQDPPPHYTLEFPYLAFLQQKSTGALGLPPQNWTVNIDLRTRLCHHAVDAAISPNCAGITGQEGCSNIVGSLQVARDSSNPGTSCGTGVCYWFDPPSRYYDENHHRSWQASSLVLTFDWRDEVGSIGNASTPASGCTVEGIRVSLSPFAYPSSLSAASNVYKGVIMMRKRTFFDGSQSLDPLGFPELGENELVFKESNFSVTLETMVSAWFGGEPPTAFLLRIPNPDGSETILADIVEWYADRLSWRSRNIPFSFDYRRYGYDQLGTPRGNIFIWTKGRYFSSLLPDYDPRSSQNRLGSQVMELVFRPSQNSPWVVVGRARYEVFFPATGTRHPSGAISEPPGLTIPNWFYYYWRAMGSPAVVFTDQGEQDAEGFYNPGQPHVYVRNHSNNYTSATFPLFAIRQGQCPRGVPQPVVTRVDTLTIRGIHAFAQTVFHEFGHKWSYETFWQFAPGAYDRILFPNTGPDQDRDNLLDAWEEAHGLCPYRRHTTDAYTHIGGENWGRPGDPEVVADVMAYGDLLNAEMYYDQQTRQWRWRPDGLWRRDWSDIGLQRGNPIERFGVFPWKYASTSGNSSTYSDLLTGWNP